MINTNNNKCGSRLYSTRGRYIYISKGLMRVRACARSYYTLIHFRFFSYIHGTRLCTWRCIRTETDLHTRKTGKRGSIKGSDYIYIRDKYAASFITHLIVKIKKELQKGAF